jgi:hypothetical protein
MSIPLVLIHGYSDSSDGFKHWQKLLIQKRALAPKDVHVLNYVSLANEVTIRDIAEGFNSELEAAIGPDTKFDAIVHSTGMLVIRAWLTRFSSMNRPARLRHLVALAPATNGSPVAHKGRSWLGALVKGKKDWGGPDFLEAGNEVLRALELASKYTWDLAESDMFGDGNTARFKKGPSSPFVFTICGDTGLGRITDLATEAVGTKIDGSDGVVRWAGAALNCRRMIIDFTEMTDASIAADAPSHMSETVSKWSNQDNILVLWPRLNHGTIMNPNGHDELVDLVSEALDVKDDNEFKDWNSKALLLAKSKRAGKKPPDNWQQFVIRVVDERGDGVTDWTIGISMIMKGKDRSKPVRIDDLHPYERDRSYRCLHVNLTEAGLDDPLVLENIEHFKMVLFMTTNSTYLVYNANRTEGTRLTQDLSKGLSELEVDLKTWLNRDDNADEFALLFPLSTTYIEFRVNRDPTKSDTQPKLVKIQTSD